MRGFGASVPCTRAPRGLHTFLFPYGIMARVPVRRKKWERGVTVITIDDYQRSIEKTFVPELARGKHAIFQYVFSGSQVGCCYAVVEDGRLSVARGKHPAPTASVYCDFDLFLRILAYEEDALLAYEDGKYRIEGDILALMESDTWFVRPPR